MSRADYKSDEEYHFALWCSEAVELGVISHWEYESITYPLSEKKTLSMPVQTPSRAKRGIPPKMVEKHLLHPHSYTPDFLIYPTERFAQFKHGLIIYHSFYSSYYHEGPDETPYVIDVKGGWMNRGTGQEFSINQKWVLDKHRIFVNKVIPEKFFTKTWVPVFAAFGKSGKRVKKYGKFKLMEEIKDGMVRELS